MGNRAGYCIRDKDGRSPILRQQWMTDPAIFTVNTWAVLSTGHKLDENNNLKNVIMKPDDGSCALRDDLDWTRAFAALVYCTYQAPFDSIHNDIHCDINNNGLFEIDIRDYKHWKVYNIRIDWNQKTGSREIEDSRQLIGEMTEYGYVDLVKGEYE